MARFAASCQWTSKRSRLNANSMLRGTGAAASAKHRMAATLRSIQGVKRCTKSRTARAPTPTGTTISTRPPTCTRAVSRRARALTRTANGSLELRVSNSDNCVPCGFIAPHDTEFGSAPHQARQLPLRLLVIWRDDQGLLDPVAGAEQIAALLE